MLKKILIIILVIILIVIVAAIIGNVSFNRMVDNEIRELLDKCSKAKTDVITEEDIAGLPDPVRKYMRFSGVVERERIRSATMKQMGRIRLKPDQKWMPFEAEQYFTVNPPGFIWKAKVNTAPLINIYGRDKYMDSRGNMLIKLLSLVKLVDATGPEIDQGSMLRFFSEAAWMPTAYLENYIKWEPVDSTSARVTMTYGGLEESALFKFTENGEPVEFIAQRYQEKDGRYEKMTWFTRISEFKEMKGFRIPAKGSAWWKLDSGDFCYIEIEIIEYELNK